MKNVVFGLAFAAVVLGGAMLLRGGKDGTQQGASSAANWADGGERQSPEVVLRISPGAPATPRPKLTGTASKVSPLMREANGAGVFKPIYERLKVSAARTPEENCVLAEMLRMCRERPAVPGEPVPAGPVNVEELRAQSKARFLASISEKDPTREKRFKAWSQGSGNKCEGLENLKVTDAEIRELLDKAAADGDPKARARVIERDLWAPLAGPDGMMRLGPDFKLPSISEAQLDALREIARSNDPSALTIAGRILASTMENLTIRAGPQEQNIDPQAFYDAWNLAACDAGYDCGANNGQVLFACYGQGNCEASDLRDVLFFYRNSPQQSQRVAEYQAQIARAVQTGDWSWFQFVRARPPSGMTFAFGQP